MGEIINIDSLGEDLAEGIRNVDLIRPADPFDLVEEGEWISEYKYDQKFAVFKRKADGKHFIAYYVRSGSYTTDYDYQDPDEMYEVERKEVVKVVWKRVK